MTNGIFKHFFLKPKLPDHLKTLVRLKATLLVAPLASIHHQWLI